MSLYGGVSLGSSICSPLKNPTHNLACAYPLIKVEWIPIQQYCFQYFILLFSRSFQQSRILSLESSVLDDPVPVGGNAGEGVGHVGLAAEGGAERGQTNHLLGVADREEGTAGVTLRIERFI